MRLVRFMIALLALTSALWLNAAQPPTNNPAAPQRRSGHPGASPAEGADQLSQELNLSEDQKAKVQAVFEEMRQKVQTAILDARTNAETELHRILTPDQYQKLQNLLQESARSHPPGPGGSNPSR